MTKVFTSIVEWIFAVGLAFVFIVGAITILRWIS